MPNYGSRIQINIFLLKEINILILVNTHVKSQLIILIILYLTDNQKNTIFVIFSIYSLYLIKDQGSKKNNSFC